MQTLIDSTLLKYKKAKRIAVENFTITAPDDRMANAINLNADARAYKWNSDTVKAIRKVLSTLGKI